MRYSSDNQLWWCKSCGVPLLKDKCENCGEEGVKMCSDLKPMFEGECKFLENEIGKKLPGIGWQDRLWIRHKTVWFNGKKLMHLSSNGKPMIVKEYLLGEETCFSHRITPEIVYRANKNTLDKLEEQAISFVKEIIEEYPKRKPVVSFSGGKDSTVVSYIVRKAVQSNSVLHIFGNTTMEYPDTLSYIAQFEQSYKDIPFCQNLNNHSFLQMCEILGPPSMLNAWCCSVFKASPIAEAVNKVNGKAGIISFDGIRRRESSRRRNRDYTYLNKKIAREFSAYPILDWKEIEVWLFILSKGLEFNTAYEKGFPRVGCMFCPYSNQYNEYLVNTHYPLHYQEWRGFLIQYARTAGKSDPEEYVSSGAWKKRVGTTEKQNIAAVRKVPCLKNANAMHFILDKKINEEFIERLKPFGKIEAFASELGKGFVVKDESTNMPLFAVKVVKDMSLLMRESSIDPNWKLGEEFLCVDILSTQNSRYLLQAIERQIKKFQACVLCGACIGVCPTNAITINPHFRVSEENCCHCRRCINTTYLRDSCVALHANQQTRRYRDGGWI